MLSLERLPTKAKEVPSPHKITLTSRDTDPVLLDLGVGFRCFHTGISIKIPSLKNCQLSLTRIILPICQTIVVIIIILLLLLLLLLLIVLLNAGLIQSCAKFYLRPQADEGWHVSLLLEYLLVIILIEIAVCLLTFRALFIIFEQYLWVLFSAFSVVVVYQRFSQ